MKEPYMKTPHLPIGMEDFAKMRQWYSPVNKATLTIADKTGFLPDLLNSLNGIIVLTRPIRFMKSSTLSMIDRFISILRKMSVVSTVAIFSR